MRSPSSSTSAPLRSRRTTGSAKCSECSLRASTTTGGTNLSKGYGIVERFSEDIDVLIVPAVPFRQTSWTSQLPDDERVLLVEAVCRMVDSYSDTGEIGPLEQLVAGWKATAGIYADARLREMVGREHAGPSVPIARPAVTTTDPVP